METLVIFAPLGILILICFFAGILLRFWLGKKLKLMSNNIRWGLYTKKILTIWLKMFGISVLAGISLLWLDGFIKIPKTNILFTIIQYATSILFGISITVIQCDFIGLGFMLVPFRDKSLMNEEIQNALNKRTNQFAIWIACFVLLLSFVLDWMIKLF